MAIVHAPLTYLSHAVWKTISYVIFHFSHQWQSFFMCSLCLTTKSSYEITRQCYIWNR